MNLYIDDDDPQVPNTQPMQSWAWAAQSCLSAMPLPVASFAGRHQIVEESPDRPSSCVFYWASAEMQLHSLCGQLWNSGTFPALHQSNFILNSF